MQETQHQQQTEEAPDAPSVCRRQVKVANSHGLHLRAASHFVQLAGQFQSDVRVCADGVAANGRSVLDLTLLGAACGTLLDLELRGTDAPAAAAALCELVEQGFHEEADGSEPTPFFSAES